MKSRESRLAATAAGLAAAIAVASLAPAAARAEGAAGAGTFSTTFATRYVWRGQTLSDGAVAQPSVGITLGGFAASLWTNVDLGGGAQPDDAVAMNETDLTLSWSVPIGPVTATAGFVHYDFESSDTQEVFASAALAAPLSPTLSLFYDVDEGDGGFAVLAVSQKIPAGPIAVTAGGSLGFDLHDEAMGLNADGEAFTGPYYGEVFLATSIPLFAHVTLDPRVAWTTGLGSDGKAAIGAASVDGRRSGLSGSVAITAAF